MFFHFSEIRLDERWEDMGDRLSELLKVLPIDWAEYLQVMNRMKS